MALNLYLLIAFLVMSIASLDSTKDVTAHITAPATPRFPTSALPGIMPAVCWPLLLPLTPSTWRQSASAAPVEDLKLT